jgi:membrane protein YqaA with SNARE-associated domain
LAWADSPHGGTALGVVSFAESSFFPIPPDLLLIPLCLGRRSKAFFYAALCTAASVAGGAAGYAIGHWLWMGLDTFFYRWIPGFTPEVYARVSDLFARYDFWVIFVAAFTPIPYKVFTVAGGVAAIQVPMFLIASILGRGGRFFLVAGLLYLYGEPIRTFIDRYFNWLSVLFVVLLAVGFLAIKQFM